MSKQDKTALAEGAAAIRLAQLEKVIERGLETFMDVGSALLEIRDNKLYKSTHKTFELYCRERWRMSKTHANRLVESSKVAGHLTPTGVIPTSERQVRPLTGLPKKTQRKVWKEAVQSANGEQPTAKKVKAVRDRVTRKLRPEPPPYIPSDDEQRALDDIEKKAGKLAEIITPQAVRVALKLDGIEKRRWLNIINPIGDLYKALAAPDEIRNLRITTV